MRKWYSGVIGEWCFLTNHARVLLSIAEEPHVRLRDIAIRADITERAAQGIISDLCQAGYLTRNRRGRRNWYQVHSHLPLRGALDNGHPVRELLEPLTSSQQAEQSASHRTDAHARTRSAPPPSRSTRPAEQHC